MITLVTPELPLSYRLFGLIPIRSASETQFAFGDRMLKVPWGKESIFLKYGSTEHEIARRQPNQRVLAYYRGLISGRNFTIDIQKGHRFPAPNQALVCPEGKPSFRVGFERINGHLVENDFCTLTVSSPEAQSLERWVRIECEEEFEHLGMILCAWVSGYIFHRLRPTPTGG